MQLCRFFPLALPWASVETFFLVTFFFLSSPCRNWGHALLFVLFKLFCPFSLSPLFLLYFSVDTRHNWAVISWTQLHHVYTLLNHPCWWRLLAEHILSESSDVFTFSLWMHERWRGCTRNSWMSELGTRSYLHWLLWLCSTRVWGLKMSRIEQVTFHTMIGGGILKGEWMHFYSKFLCLFIQEGLIFKSDLFYTINHYNL